MSVQEIIVCEYCRAEKRNNNEKKIRFLRANYFFDTTKNCLPNIFHKNGNLMYNETKNNGRSFTRTILYGKNFDSDCSMVKS